MRNRIGRDFVLDNQISQCNRCGEDITWMYTSKRTGKAYPTNVLAADGQPVSCKLWFHQCRPEMVEYWKSQNGNPVNPHGKMMRARHDGTCDICNTPIKRGEAIRWSPETKKAVHGECAERTDRMAKVKEEVAKEVKKVAEEQGITLPDEAPF